MSSCLCSSYEVPSNLSQIHQKQIILDYDCCSKLRRMSRMQSGKHQNCSDIEKVSKTLPPEQNCSGSGNSILPDTIEVHSSTIASRNILLRLASLVQLLLSLHNYANRNYSTYIKSFAHKTIPEVIKPYIVRPNCRYCCTSKIYRTGHSVFF